MTLNRKLLYPGSVENTANSGGGGGREPGSVENRLSLDPSDEKWSDKVDAWEDGEKYTITVEATQISAGEFEVEKVTSAKPSAGEEPDDDSDDMEDDSEEEMPRKKKSNPAIDRLMEE